MHLALRAKCFYSYQYHYHFHVNIDIITSDSKEVLHSLWLVGQDFVTEAITRTYIIKRKINYPQIYIDEIKNIAITE